VKTAVTCMWTTLGALLAALLLVHCSEDAQTVTERQQADQQGASLQQANAQIGMPAIKDFQEKKMVKDLYEERDKAIGTYVYLFNEMRSCLMYLGPAQGYGLPYGTQYTSPTRLSSMGGGGYIQVPQPEPNGLYMPASAEGTWVMTKNPEADETKAVYFEPRVIVSPFRFKAQECQSDQAAAPLPLPKSK